MPYDVVWAGEPPPGRVVQELFASGVRLKGTPGAPPDAIRRELADPSVRGYLMNSFAELPDGPRADDGLLEGAPGLEVVTYMGASRELADYASYVDVAAVRRRGIAFTSTATADDAVAESAVGLLHALELDLLRTHRSGVRPGTRAGLAGSTLGILGMGQLGHRVAELVAPLGLDLVYCSRSRHTDVEELYGARRLDLDDLFATADHVSVHLPNSAPAGLIGAGALGRARAITLVDTTSAPRHLDPEALLAALRSGRVRRAAIEGSFGPAYDRALREIDDERVVLLPAYTSWDTERSRAVGWSMVGQTYRAAARGEPIPHRLA